MNILSLLPIASPQAAIAMPASNTNGQLSSMGRDLIGRYAAYAALLSGLNGCAASEAKAPVAPPAVEAQAATQSQNADAIGYLRGYVREPGKDEFISGATVQISYEDGRHISLTTGEDGSVIFRKVPIGVVRIRASAPGYQPTEDSVRIREGVGAVEGKLLFLHPEIDEKRMSGMDENIADADSAAPANNAKAERLTSVGNAAIVQNRLELKNPIQFKRGSVELAMSQSQFDAIIDDIVAILKNRHDIHLLQIRAHTDRHTKDGQTITYRRAQLIKEALRQRGINPSRLDSRGYGEDHPLVPNISEENFAINNRIEFRINPRNEL